MSSPLSYCYIVPLTILSSSSSSSSSTNFIATQVLQKLHISLAVIFAIDLDISSPWPWPWIPIVLLNVTGLQCFVYHTLRRIFELIPMPSALKRSPDNVVFGNIMINCDIFNDFTENAITDYNRHCRPSISVDNYW